MPANLILLCRHSAWHYYFKTTLKSAYQALVWQVYQKKLKLHTSKPGMLKCQVNEGVRVFHRLPFLSDYVTNWPLEASCCLTERILSVRGRRIPSCSRTSAVQLHHTVRLESDDLPRKMLFYFVRSVIWQFVPFRIDSFNNSCRSRE